MEQFDQNINNNSDNLGDELNLTEIINFFKRNYKFLSIFTFLAIVISSIYSLTIKPTWQGEFQIVLKTQSDNQPNLGSRFSGLNCCSAHSKCFILLMTSDSQNISMF